MNTAITSRPTVPTHTQSAGRPSPTRRFFSVVRRPESYRNIVYLHLGLPLSILWFTVLVTALSVSLSMVAVALLGIPLLLATWYIIRAFANVERGLANLLLRANLRAAPMASPHRGNPWLRLTAMSRERGRWRELAYLFVRIPVGIATFAIAVTALATPLAIIYTPIHARYVDDFGDWFWSSELHNFAASSPWSWALVPFGLGIVVLSIHLLNALANRCRGWTTAWLDIDPS